MPSYLVVTPIPEQALEVLASLVDEPFETDHPDCLTIDEAGLIGIDRIRELKHFLARRPYSRHSQQVFVPHAERLTIPAQNALLKTLEEPPEQAQLVLAARHESQLLATIVSRCRIIRPTLTTLKQTSDIAPELISLLKLPIWKRIQLAGRLGYPKERAKDWLVKATYHFREELRLKPTLNTLANLKLTLETLARIEANVDPRLALEELFLQLLTSGQEMGGGGD